MRKRIYELNLKNYFEDFIPKFWVSLRSGYLFKFFKSDLISGLTVAVIALPLAMAFAIASGLDPSKGLYTAVIAGLLISFFGGGFYQIAGPAGSFIIIISDVIQREGFVGLLLATSIAGIILIGLGLAKLGSLIKYIPYPLITGFTSGIAVMVFSSQIKDFFGLSVPHGSVRFIPKCIALASFFHTWDLLTTCTGALTLGTILLIRRFSKVPWGITSILSITIICWFFNLPVETIGSRYGAVSFIISLPFLETAHFLGRDWGFLFQSAITIAFICSIESLLSAVVSDGMTGKTHKSNCELVAQGFANLASACLGGMPACSAISRTLINIRAGAKTPLSGIIHALTLFCIVYFLSPLLSFIPLSALSAVLVMIAWNMIEFQSIRTIFRAPKGDSFVFMVTMALTIFTDLIVALEIGMILAAFLFMKRIRDLSGIAPTALVEDEKSAQENLDPDAIDKKRIPQGVCVYEIKGLFFFGLADTLKATLSKLETPPKVFILRLRKVPSIDATGMHALKEFQQKCNRENTTLLLSGVNTKVYFSLKKFGLVQLIGKQQIFSHIDPSLERAAQLCSPDERTSLEIEVNRS